MNTTKDMSSDIRETIAETREKMDDTIEELGQRLNPKQIAQEVGTWWEELVDADTLDRVKDRGADVVEHVERHPVPYALVGLGIGLGVYAAFKDHSRTRRQVRRLRHRAGDAMESARDASEHAMDSAKEASGHAAETVKHAYESTADSVKDGYDRASAAAEDFAGHARSAARGAGDAFQRATDEQPLVVGAGLAAAGLLVGLLLPAPNPRID